MTGYAYRPAGGIEIPGFDPDYETYAKHEDQTVDVKGVGEVTVKAGSFLRVYRQSDGRLYNENDDHPITLDNCSQDIKELEAPLAAGETLSFEFHIMVTGLPEENVGVCVRTPPNPTGGFQVVSVDVEEEVFGDTFSADYFNNPAGMCRAGNEGTLESHNTIKVRGVLGNGPRPGLLKVQLGPAFGLHIIWGGQSFTDLFRHEWSNVLDVGEFIILHIEGAFSNAIEMMDHEPTFAEVQAFIAAETPFFYAQGTWSLLESYTRERVGLPSRTSHFVTGHIATLDDFYYTNAGDTDFAVNVYYGPTKLEKGKGHSLDSVLRSEIVESSDNPAVIPWDDLADEDNITILFPLDDGTGDSYTVSPSMNQLQNVNDDLHFGHVDGPFTVTYETARTVPIGYFLCEIEHNKT